MKIKSNVKAGEFLLVRTEPKVTSDPTVTSPTYTEPAGSGSSAVFEGH